MTEQEPGMDDSAALTLAEAVLARTRNKDERRALRVVIAIARAALLTDSAEEGAGSPPAPHPAREQKGFE
tara:strand:- start:818 stop:1027 length:210 start_codon:yes stop_codon:yes gene_type:complete